MRRIDTVIVHHSAGPDTATIEDIRRIHQAKGWTDIGYHWLVHRLWAGGPWTLSPGRSEALVGAHDLGQNETSVGICIAGDYTKGPVPVDGWHVLLATCVSRCQAHQLAVDRVEGHREHEPSSTPTECPGFDPASLRRDLAPLLRLAV
jgi:N-acetylmuramoyl-L-alanine amidase